MFVVYSLHPVSIDVKGQELNFVWFLLSLYKQKNI